MGSNSTSSATKRKPATVSKKKAPPSRKKPASPPPPARKPAGNSNSTPAVPKNKNGTSASNPSGSSTVNGNASSSTNKTDSTKNNGNKEAQSQLEKGRDNPSDDVQLSKETEDSEDSKSRVNLASLAGENEDKSIAGDKKSAENSSEPNKPDSKQDQTKPKLPTRDDLLTGTNREEAQKQVMKLAMEGNPEAIALLGQSLDQYHELEQEGRTAELTEGGDWVVDSLAAVQQRGYEQNKEWLTPENYKSLELELDDPNVEKMFQKTIGRGNESVLQSMRAYADTKGHDYNQSVSRSEAGELLSYAGKHAEEGDYARMLQSHVSPGNSNTTQAFRSALENKTPGAREALQEQLAGKDPGRAAEMLGQMTEYIGDREMSQLKEVASGDSFDRERAKTTLQRAAGAGRPGAEEAVKGMEADEDARRLGQLDALSEKAAAGDPDAMAEYRAQLRNSDYDISSSSKSHMREKFNAGHLWPIDASRGVNDVKYARNEMAESLAERYTESKDPALAAHVLDTAPNSELAKQALKDVTQRAKGGDERAIESMARFVTDNPRPVMDKNAFEGREEIAQDVMGQLSQLSSDGHAQSVTDSLLDVHAEGVETAKNEKYHDFKPKADLFRALGDSAGHLSADNESSDEARELLLDQLPKRPMDGHGVRDERAGAALEGLSHLTDTLDREQTAELREFATKEDHEMGVKATGLVKESSQKFSPEEQQKIASDMLKELRNPHYRSDFQKLDLLKENLSNDDIKALTKSGRSGSSQFLTGLLGQDGVPAAAQESIVREIAANGGRGLNAEQRAQIVDFAANTHNNELKDLVVDKVLPDSPNLTNELQDLNTHFSRRLFNETQAALKKGDTSDPMYKLGELMKAQQLGLHGEYADQIDQEKVARQIDDLVKGSPRLQRAIGDVRNDALDSWKRYGKGHEAVAKQRDYLQSDTFQQKLRLMDPAQRDAFMAQEVQKMALLAPDQVEGMVEGISKEQMEQVKDAPLEGLGRLSLAEREKVIGEVLRETMKGDEHFDKIFGDTKTGTKAYKDLVNEIAKQKPGVRKDKLMGLLKRVGLHNTDGRLSAALGAMGLMGLSDKVFQGEMPDDFRSVVSTGAALNGVAGSLYPTYKLGASMASKFTTLSRPGAKTIRALRFAKGITGRAPVIGDGLATLLDANSAIDSFMKGDKAKAGAYAGATVLGGIATGAGIYGIAAGVAFGPPGWIALGAGLAATGVSYAASNMDGKDEAMLKRLGAFKPAAAAFHAMNGAGTARGQLIRALRGHSAEEMKEIKAEYSRLFDSDLVNDIQWDTSGNFESFLTSLAKGYRTDVNYNSRQDAQSLYKAMKGWGTTNSTLTRILAGRSPAQLRKIAEDFESFSNGQSLVSWLKSDTSGQFERAILEQLRHAGVD